METHAPYGAESEKTAEKIKKKTFSLFLIPFVLIFLEEGRPSSKRQVDHAMILPRTKYLDDRQAHPFDMIEISISAFCKKRLRLYAKIDFEM